MQTTGRGEPRATYTQGVVVLLELIHNRGESFVLGLIPPGASLQEEVGSALRFEEA